MSSKVSHHSAGESQNVHTLSSLHEESILDSQFDHYGTQLASSDSNGFLQFSSIRADGTQDEVQTF
jgi:hypothetical protein